MAVVAVIFCIILYVAGYRFYSSYLSRKIFSLRPDAVTPAHALEDGVDYLPTHRFVLFGHHFASITGLSPMLGPAIAVIWGWLPAMLWVVFGALLVGCVHDFGALVLSVRARGMSIGVVAHGIMGPRAKSLLHALIFFGVSLAMGVFVYVVAVLFSGDYPQSVMPSTTILVLALIVGWLVRRHGFNLWKLTAAGFVVILVVVSLSSWIPFHWTDQGGWTWVLLGYAWLASVLPVWSLLQPRDFLNSLLLYLGLGLTYIGFFVLRPEFVAPAIDTHPEGAPPIFPFVFIVIACGAASGFHSLVSSGTTAKQLNRETDARPIAYGGMMGESLLGLAAVLACTAGFVSTDQWRQYYQSWDAVDTLGAKIAAFIEGSTRFVSSLGVPEEAARTLIAVVVVSFALTTLDSATRLLRFNVEEIGQSLGLRLNRYVASTIAAGAIAFFAFYKVDGKAAGLALWQLFGSTNQLLAGLALLVVSLYLIQRKRRSLPYLLPMLFMMVSTLTAMAFKLADFYRQGDRVLLTVGACISVVAVWLVVESFIALARYRREGTVEDLDIPVNES
jgi:carbon starvation protein